MTSDVLTEISLILQIAAAAVAIVRDCRNARQDDHKEKRDKAHDDTARR
ncbi:hypothetical protein [Actinomadura oligospora]|nr:hypothetical protein [Actinomadura oligospora]